MPNPLVFIARGLLSSVFVTGGLNQLKAPQALGPVVERAEEKYGLHLPVDGTDLVKLNGGGMVAAGATLALGILPKTSALTLAAMLVPTTLVGHAYWDQDDPGKRFEHRNGFYSNAAVLGGLLLVSARK